MSRHPLGAAIHVYNNKINTVNYKRHTHVPLLSGKPILFAPGHNKLYNSNRYLQYLLEYVLYSSSYDN